MNLETKITIYKFTPQLFTLTPLLISCGILSPVYQTFALFVVYAAFPHLTLL